MFLSKVNEHIGMILYIGKDLIKDFNANCLNLNKFYKYLQKVISVRRFNYQFSLTYSINER